MVDLVRGVGLRVLLVERHPMRHRQTTTTMLDRPAQTGQPGSGQMAIPGQSLLERLVLATRSAKPFQRGEVTDQIVGEPTANLGAELLDVHRCRVTYQALALVARTGRSEPSGAS